MFEELLVEIGTEEIPARFLNAALAELSQKTALALSENRLQYGEIKTWATPRRLVLNVKNLASEQEEKTEEVKGPPSSKAFDAEGRPSPAALGFAKSQGVRVEDLFVKETAQGEYVFARRNLPQQKTEDLLPQILPSLFLSLSFPRLMRWGDYDLKFVRPVRWIFSLFGQKLISWEFFGVKADSFSYGHRFLHPQKVFLENASAENYRQRLKEAYVIVDPKERQNLILKGIAALDQEKGIKTEIDLSLLDEVNFLLEYPTVFCGSFKSDYLQIPPEVLITAMKSHQRYFPVKDKKGNLLPFFVGVRNGNSSYIENVIAGNETVLEARLADARFFWEEDLKTPLEKLVSGLQKVIFQEKLGTMYDKVERLQSLVLTLNKELNFAMEEAMLQRAAYLAKADLLTHMVYEFPELEGIMGYYYAKAGGEKEEVAQAILEHYRPRFHKDKVPQTKGGILLSLADKLDAVVGYFALGFKPTGSEDPFALRRQSLAIIDILLEKEISFSLSQLFSLTYQNYRQSDFFYGEDKTREELLAFFEQRLSGIFNEEGFRYDEIDAVLAVDRDDPFDALLRLQALQSFRLTPQFADLITTFKRVANLALKYEEGQVEPSHFEEETEEILWRKFQQLKEKTKPLWKSKNYREIFLEISQLRPLVDRFFDKVLVMAEKEILRRNRLALLKEIEDYISQIVDFTKIVVEN